MKFPLNLASAIAYAVVAQCATGCSSQHEPAKLALEEIQIAMEMASPDAQKYLPDQAIFVQKEVARLNVSYQSGDYSSVVADSPVILLDAEHLAAAATTKRQESIMHLVHEWTMLDSSLPPLFSAVRARLEVLSKIRHAPKGVDVAAVKTNITEGTGLWNKGQAAFNANRLEEAVAFLEDAKPRLDAAAEALQLPLPGTD